jgi:hypothetical protein
VVPGVKGIVKRDQVLLACSQVNNGRFCQETYETPFRDAARRARQLRLAGYQVAVGPMGPQVTPVGVVKLTLVDIRPGTHADTFNLPEVGTVNLR